MSAKAKIQIPKSKEKMPSGRFRDYFSSWMKDHPGVIDVPPPVMASLIRVCSRNRKEMEHLMAFCRRYKNVAASDIGVEDVAEAYKLLDVKAVLEG